MFSGSSPSEYRLQHAIDEVKSTYGETVFIKPKRLFKFGKNSAVGNTAEYTIMNLQGAETEETYAAGNTIDSVSCTDTNFTGLVTVEYHTISGTDLTFGVQQVTANGQNKVALTTPAARISRCYVAGTSGLDAGEQFFVFDDTGVTLSGGVPSDDTKVHLTMEGGDNQSQKASTSISARDYYFITNIFGSVNKKTTAVVDIKLKIRTIGNDYFRTITQPITLNTAGSTFFQKDLDPLIIVPKNSDIIMTAIASTTGVEVSAGMNGYLAALGG